MTSLSMIEQFFDRTVQLCGAFYINKIWNQLYIHLFSHFNII